MNIQKIFNFIGNKVPNYKIIYNDDKIEIPFEGGYRNSNFKKEGTHTKRFPNGQIKSIRKYKNGKKHGLQKTFGLDGTPVYEIEFDNGKLHGDFIEYYPNGQVSRFIQGSNGKKNGIYKKFSMSGQLLQLRTFKDDIEHGPAEDYNHDGKLLAKYNYVNGKVIE